MDEREGVVVSGRKGAIVIWIGMMFCQDISLMEGKMLMEENMMMH